MTQRTTFPEHINKFMYDKMLFLIDDLIANRNYKQTASDLTDMINIWLLTLRLRYRYNTMTLTYASMDKLRDFSKLALSFHDQHLADTESITMIICSYISNYFNMIPDSSLPNPMVKSITLEINEYI